jgi:2,3-bisphosphoglycerate-dependent phosphoglycerate mutase
MSSHTSGQLIILRHGESKWNAKGVWTGTTNVDLTPKGNHEAVLMGQQCRGLDIDVAFVSQQVRTLETLQGVLKGMGHHPHVPYHISPAINERDYGIYTGKNKWHIEQEVGEGRFNDIRRGWNVPIPHGETLKEVYERTVPFYLHTIVPLLLAGKNVMVVAHGNSIRSLMKYIESISDTKVQDLEMIFGTILIYRVDDNGRMKHKDVRTIATTLPPA